MTPKPLASVIIPTYNRCRSLEAALASVASVDFPPNRMEVIVVDNGSSDDTPRVVAAAARERAVRYVLEPRLSFTRARHTGAEASAGAFLLYIDDDVTVTPGWPAAVVAVFEADTRVGVVSGPIRAVYEIEPPDWAVNTPGLFNGLSLWERGPVLHESDWAPGPNLCVRRAVLEAVGGFPPDTLGLDVAGGPATVERIYVGDGDYGLCRRVRRAGYKVMYAPEAAVDHHIPATRLTRDWWRARLAGEGSMHAFVDWQEHSRGLPLVALRLSWHSIKRSVLLGRRVVLNMLDGKHWVEMLEFQWAYVTARARMQLALFRHPSLGDRLWDIALTGVPPDDVEKVLAMLPGRR